MTYPQRWISGIKGGLNYPEKKGFQCEHGKISQFSLNRDLHPSVVVLNVLKNGFVCTYCVQVHEDV